MADLKNNGNNMLNLLVLGVAIVLVLIVMQNPENFVGQVPRVPIGNAMYNPQQILPGGYPTGQPMMYPMQYYPAKMPWAPETGRPCEKSGGCGSMGSCQNGVCSVKDHYDTVFNIPV